MVDYRIIPSCVVLLLGWCWSCVCYPLTRRFIVFAPFVNYRMAIGRSCYGIDNDIDSIQSYRIEVIFDYTDNM